MVRNRSKKIRCRADGFRWSEQEDTVGRECIVEGLDHLALRQGRQVNQYILTREQINPRERRVLEQIVLGEDAELTDGPVNLVAAVDGAKEVIETCGREHTDGGLWIETCPGVLDGF